MDKVTAALAFAQAHVGQLVSGAAVIGLMFHYNVDVSAVTTDVQAMITAVGGVVGAGYAISGGCHGHGGGTMNWRKTLCLAYIALAGCTAVTQVAQDEKFLPPTAAAVADAYATIQTAAAIGAQVCNPIPPATAPLMAGATCIRLQAQLQQALDTVNMVASLLGSGETVTAADTSQFAAALPAIQAVLAQVQAALAAQVKS
jgi:hypothetical protein